MRKKKGLLSNTKTAKNIKLDKGKEFENQVKKASAKKQSVKKELPAKKTESKKKSISSKNVKSLSDSKSLSDVKSSKSSKSQKEQVKKAPAKKQSSKKKQSKPEVPKVNKYKDSDFSSLYQRLRRRIKKVEEIAIEKKRGWKTKRSEVYKEIIDINKDLVSLVKRKGFELPKSIKDRQKNYRSKKKKLEEKDKKAKTITGTENVWKYEEMLIDLLKGGRFKKIVLVNIGKTLYTNKSSISTILFWYDQARDEAYKDKYASTPFVQYTEDYGNSILTLEFLY